jgi:hypothetical protein
MAVEWPAGWWALALTVARGHLAINIPSRALPEGLNEIRPWEVQMQAPGRDRPSLPFVLAESGVDALVQLWTAGTDAV